MARMSKVVTAGLAAVVVGVGLLVGTSGEAQAVTPAVGPSGEAVPIGDLPGWHQTFVDDFTKDALIGTMGSTDSQAVIYTGDHGGQWVEYPDGWPSTYSNGKPGYQPKQVLSVQGGVLDFYLHSVGGLPSGANPSPLVTGTSKYQTYGRYTARIKSDTIANYKTAWLLWPVDDKNGGCAESDFPEANLNGTVTAFAHNAKKCKDYRTQDAFRSSVPIGDGAWHTYTQEWSPGSRKYYIDGTLLGTSTTNVWSAPERWQLQTEMTGAGTGEGHLQVDWVAAYSYVGTGAAPAAASVVEAPEATKKKEAGSVHEGASCSRAGALGSTDTGAAMTCSGSPAAWRTRTA